MLKHTRSQRLWYALRLMLPPGHLTEFELTALRVAHSRLNGEICVCKPSVEALAIDIIDDALKMETLSDSDLAVMVGANELRKAAQALSVQQPKELAA